MKDSFIISLYLMRLLYPYKPFLDDYIQYRVYALHPEPVKRIFIEAGTCATRPAANLLDLILYSEFGSILYIPYAIMVLMYLAFILLLKKLLDKVNVHTGSLFLIITLLCPLNIEGTVWISASTRIVPGLLLSALSLWLITDKICSWRLFLFVPINLLSFLFYEQTAAFTLFMAVLISLRKSNFSPIVISFTNALITVIYYFIFRNYGVFSHRMSAVGTFDIYSFLSGAARCISACVHTVLRGRYLYAVAAVPALFIARRLCASSFSTAKLLLGAAIATLSLLPTAIAGMYDIPFRCLVIPLIGYALMLDCTGNAKLYRIFAWILTVMFISSSAAEFRNYDISTDTDSRVLNYVAEAVSENPGKTVAVHGAKRYYTDSPANHAEHIAAITSSDWALTGALRAILKNPDLPLIKLNEQADVNIRLE